MEYTKEDIIETPENIKGVVVGLEVVKASEIFGKKTDDPDKKLIKIIWENAELGIKGFDQISYYEKGKVLARSNIAKFIKKYGSLKIGVVINLNQNIEGFYKIYLQ